jgi:hypothetical protein
MNTYFLQPISIHYALTHLKLLFLGILNIHLLIIVFRENINLQEFEFFSIFSLI